MEIKRQTKKEFTPISVTLEIKTINEARTLYHLLNRGAIMEFVKSGTYWISIYSDEYDRDLTHLKANELREEIESQGFKI